MTGKNTTENMCNCPVGTFFKKGEFPGKRVVGQGQEKVD